MKRFLKQIFDVYNPFRLVMLGVFGFIALSQALNLVAPFLQGKVIDSLVNKKPINEVYLLVGLTFAISIFRIVVIGYRREKFELKNIDFAVNQHANKVTIEKLLGFSIGQHISENSGIKQSIISRGQHSLTSLVYMVLYQVLPMCVEVILLIGVLLYFSAILGLIVLCGAIVYVSFVFYTNLHFRKDFKKVETMYNKNSKFQGEILKNVELVLVNAQEKRAVAECNESLGKVSDFCCNMWLRFNIFSAFRGLIISLVSVSVMAVGIMLVYRGKYTIGQLVMFLSWSGSALSQIANAGNLHRQMIQMYSSVKKYFDMLDIEPDVKVIPNPVRPEKFFGRIEFRNVTLSYKGRDLPDISNKDEEEDEEKPKSTEEKKEVGPALKNISFIIESGQTVALVGESGAGKSTIAYALLRSQDPQEGQIVVDGNDLRVLDLKKFRESVGLVDQHVPLFDNTLRYNMLYSLNGHAVQMTKEGLDQVAEMSCVNRFFDRLENGYDTLIGERGVKLSGGERQRVGIARALAKEPDILIFDEATSNLDSENESLIRESIEKVSKGRTTIIIAHRFSTIRNVDKIFVFDKGEIVGQGTHEELSKSCEHYQRLVKNQVF
jgi:ATP-binding cassette subfamily B protein